MASVIIVSSSYENTERSDDEALRRRQSRGRVCLLYVPRVSRLAIRVTVDLPSPTVFATAAFFKNQKRHKTLYHIRETTKWNKYKNTKCKKKTKQT